METSETVLKDFLPIFLHFKKPQKNFRAFYED